jgi:hypothetical protein
MKHIKISFCLLVMSGFSMTIEAQNTITTSGGNATGTGGTVSYTVGQIVYNNYSGTNGIITQGVQQPYEITVVTALEESKDINLICSVYPNPTNSFLTLIVGDYENVDFSYWLYGISGNFIETQKVLVNETHINLQNQVSGSYFLKITSGNRVIKTFKIIKK